MSYDYVSAAKKLKLFPTTLKNATLQWLMGLSGNNIGTWEEMKKVFLGKYRDYCKDKYCKDEVLRVS